MAITEAAASVCSLTKPTFKVVTQEDATEPSDSGDEDLILDQAVVSPFEPVETILIQECVADFWEKFAMAQSQKFL